MTALLEIADLNAYYGSSHVLQNVSLEVGTDEVVALLGRNGVGKTTLIHTIMGMVPRSDGTVVFDGVDLTGRPTHAAAQAGLGLVPQGRRVWAPLTVEENLRIAARGQGEWDVPRVYELLPRLHERRRNRGNQLSGGEQQMLSIGRALLGNPKLLLLDEPFEGLAPLIIERILEVLDGLVRLGMPVLIVEENLSVVVRLAQRVIIMDRGQVVHRATLEEFRGQRALAHELLGVG